LAAAAVTATKSIPANNSLSKVSGATPYLTPAGAPLVAMAGQALAPAGGDQPHNNMQPYLTLNFCIALQGVYPPRT
jgi:microcystin-dependent protein